MKYRVVGREKQMPFRSIKQLTEQVKESVAQVIVGKEEVVDLLLIALITSGHVLLEDVPGTGKTLLAKSLAKSLKLQFKRVQFTPDLLPSDLSGIHYYNQKTSDFEFRPGPLFTNLLLADEINRATPRTQSSLLECMEERQVSIDGRSMVLEQPFMVIATQNPIEHQGTFALPEAQLDRFLFKIKMGYPTTVESVQLLKRFMMEQPLEALSAVASQQLIVEAQAAYRHVRITDDLLNYIVSIVEATRQREEVAIGVSPRGMQALLRAVQVKAVMQGRDFVTPDDVKAMIKPTLAHRMTLRGMQKLQRSTENILNEIMEQIAVPTESEVSIS
ncbi:AAA family ATPase [Paenibacillus yanchengensis]|uniref:AAA family ATPase n=1 Tax=Paenibacillus yanchengensis TaxID=2035833 RepID=A0ABW4YQK0_9BACL